MQYRITYVRQGRNKLRSVDAGGNPEDVLKRLQNKYPDGSQWQIWQEYAPKAVKALKPAKVKVAEPAKVK